MREYRNGVLILSLWPGGGGDERRMCLQVKSSVTVSILQVPRMAHAATLDCCEMSVLVAFFELGLFGRISQEAHSQ